MLCCIALLHAGKLCDRDCCQAWKMCMMVLLRVVVVAMGALSNIKKEHFDSSNSSSNSRFTMAITISSSSSRFEGRLGFEGLQHSAISHD